MRYLFDKSILQLQWKSYAPPERSVSVLPYSTPLNQTCFRMCHESNFVGPYSFRMAFSTLKDLNEFFGQLPSSCLRKKRQALDCTKINELN